MFARKREANTTQPVVLPQGANKHKKFAKSSTTSSKSAGVHTINKSDFLQNDEQEEMLERGQSELNAMFVSANSTEKSFDAIKKIAFPNKNIVRADDLSFLQFLNRVELNNNELRNLKFLQDNYDVNYVNISHNKIESLVPLKNMKLQVLNASHNEIESLSSECFASSTETLKALILNNNQLSSFPDIRFKDLNTLVLSDNELKNIDFISKCEALKKISAANNLIRVLPESIKRCGSLEELRLAHNKIMSLPLAISSNVNLQILNLSHNLISSFDEIKKLSLCKKLKNLSLKNNPIASKPDYKEQILKILPQLEILDDESLRESTKKRSKPSKDKEEEYESKSNKRKHESTNDEEQPKKKQKKDVLSKPEKTSVKKSTKSQVKSDKKAAIQKEEDDEEENEIMQDLSEEKFEVKKLIDENKEKKAKQALLEEKKKLEKDGMEPVNVREESLVKRISKEQNGGYAEQDDKHSGVRKSTQNKRHRKANSSDVLKFLLSKTDEEESVGGWD